MDTALKQVGIRPTKARATLLNLLQHNQTPQRADQLFAAFPFSIHKVTLYRDLKMFVEAGLVEPVYLEERSVRYQFKSGHIHHLICEGCGQIDNVELPNDLADEEKKIKHQKQFLVTRHALEFYGLCRGCQPKLSGSR